MADKLQVPAGWKLLKDTTYEERSWPEDYDHENGRYCNTCCNCLREFIGHKRRVICKVCASIGDTPAPQSTEGVDASADPKVTAALDTLGKLGALEPDPTYGVKGTPAPSPLLTPRAWQMEAMTRAAKLTGSPDGALALVEAKRYGLMADELERIAAGVAIPQTGQEN